MADMVNHPPHYKTGFPHSPCGEPIEVIDISRHLDFSLGNAVKYILRAGRKNSLVEDLKKARWYLDDRITQLEAVAEGESDLVVREQEEEEEDKLECGHTRATHPASDVPSCFAHRLNPARKARTWPGLLHVEYVPSGELDPWRHMAWSDTVSGDERVDELMIRVLLALGIGNPDGFTLRIAGTTDFLRLSDVIRDVVGYGEGLQLERTERPTSLHALAPAHPVYGYSSACGKHAACWLKTWCPGPDKCSAESRNPQVANKDRTQL